MIIEYEEKKRKGWVNAHRYVTGIKFCCVEMKSAVNKEIITEFDTTLSIRGEDRNESEYIDYCPFCGEKIECSKV